MTWLYEPSVSALEGEEEEGVGMLPLTPVCCLC